MKNQPAHHGVIVPLVTPLTSNGMIDEKATEKIVTHIIDAGAFPFALGTTGEAMSLSLHQRKLYMTLVKKYAGTAMTYVGVTANSFEETVALAGYARDLGFDAIVPHLPSYFPLSADLMLHYYERLSEETELPMILYNIPITTGMSIPLEVVEQLSHHPGIVGLKDSERGEERLLRNLALWRDRKDFGFFLGCAANSARGMLGGADGIVPSVGNLIPGLYQEIVKFGLAGNADRALWYQNVCDAVSGCCYTGRTVVDGIPALKYMLHLTDWCGPDVALPMRKPDVENKAAIHQALQEVVERYQLVVINQKK